MPIHPQPPCHTRWGAVQHSTQIAPGIWFLDTLSHGAVWLAPDRNALVPADIRDATFERHGNAGLYEEDVDWTIPATLFAAEFDGHDRTAGLNNGPASRRAILEHFKPGLFDRLTALSIALQKEEVTCR